MTSRTRPSEKHSCVGASRARHRPFVAAIYIDTAGLAAHYPPAIYVLACFFVFARCGFPAKLPTPGSLVKSSHHARLFVAAPECVRLAYRARLARGPWREGTFLRASQEEIIMETGIV